MDRNKRSQKIGKCLGIVGSTASGKSALALALAKALGGEIISVDSMQVYRSMDVGTAKPTKEELAAVVHHMIDICDPFTSFSAADFADTAIDCAENISKRGRLPIFCGGTGLYLDTVLRGGAPAETSADENIRKELLKFADEYGAHALHERLREADPESAAQIHENNIKRVARALEIYLASGVPKSRWDRESRDMPSAVDIKVFGLFYHNRETLYERINKRVLQMLEGGLIEETKRLYEAGVFEKNSTAAGAIGYKELLPYIKGEMSLEEAVDRLQTATRRYAKRQITWFSAKPYVEKLYCDNPDGSQRSFDDILNELIRRF